MIRAIIKTLKVKHYVKNLIVIFPLLFSMSFYKSVSVFECFIIFVSFCAISSAVYILNDLVDRKKDLKHPIKKFRPIASGKISIKQAVLLLCILFLISIITSFSLNNLCLFCVLLYFILNIFYSFLLKNIVLVDAACIAVGFILRILAGCFAIRVLPSPLVILLTFFTSMFFTFSKRKLELGLLKGENCMRKSILSFDISTLEHLVLSNAILSIAFYIVYTLDSATILRAGSSYLYITVIPFTLIVFRLLMLVESKNINFDDPMGFIEKDKILKFFFLFYLIVLAIILF